MDFVSDRLADGTVFRILTVVDHFSRLTLALEARRSFRGEAVAQVLDALTGEHGYPDFITVDNGLNASLSRAEVDINLLPSRSRAPIFFALSPPSFRSGLPPDWDPLTIMNTRSALACGLTAPETA